MNILFMGTFRCSKNIKTDMAMINTKVRLRPGREVKGIGSDA